MGGWGKIENKDHLSPTETEIGAELGKSQGLLNQEADINCYIVKGQVDIAFLDKGGC